MNSQNTYLALVLLSCIGMSGLGCGQGYSSVSRHQKFTPEQEKQNRSFENLISDTTYLVNVPVGSKLSFGRKLNLPGNTSPCVVLDQFVSVQKGMFFQPSASGKFVSLDLESSNAERERLDFDSNKPLGSWYPLLAETTSSIDSNTLFVVEKVTAGPQERQVNIFLKDLSADSNSNRPDCSHYGQRAENLGTLSILVPSFAAGPITVRHLKEVLGTQMRLRAP